MKPLRILIFFFWICTGSAFAASSNWDEMIWDQDDWHAIGEINVSPSSFDVFEPNNSKPFTVSLSSEPTDEVTVNLVFSCDEVDLSTNSVTLSSGVMSADVYVTARDDNISDGTQTCTVTTQPAISGDGNYDGKDPGDVTVYVHDNDTASFILAIPSIAVSEPSESETITIKLGSEPTKDVNIGLSVSNGQATVSPSSLTIHSGNWQNGATAVVTAQNDDVVDGTQTCMVVTTNAVSDDPSYHGKSVPDFKVYVQDDDGAGLVVDRSSMTVSEPNGTDYFMVRLSSQPSHDVTVYVSPSNNEAMVSQSPLTFSPSNWNQAKSVDITAFSDDKIDGAQSCDIVMSARSADPDYVIANAPYVKVTVLDNTTGFRVDAIYPTYGKVGEPLPNVFVQGAGFREGTQDAIVGVSMYHENDDGDIDGPEIPVGLFNVINASNMTMTLPAPAVKGNYTLRFWLSGGFSVDVKSAVTFGDTFSGFKAIIVAGKDVENSPLWNPTKANAHKAYKTLLKRGFLKENIHYLSSEGNVDVDGDGVYDDWDGEAMLSVLNDKIDECVNGGPMPQFVMYLVGHGGSGTFRVSPSEVLTAEQLNVSLNNIQANVDGELFFIYDACSSGTFLDPLKHTPGRTVISSAGDHPAMFFDQEGLSFSSVFWPVIGNAFPVSGAFIHGRAMMLNYQSALLDANGDGVFVEGAGGDTDLVTDVYIGRGGVPASDTPIIDGLVVSPENPSGTVKEATITAGPVTDGDGITRVWAVITPPCFDYGASQDMIIEFPLPIQSPPTEGVYSGSYPDFKNDGQYRIIVYAKDKRGFYSTTPRRSTLTKSDGVPCGVKGDLNEDGLITLADLVIALKTLAGIDTSSLLPADCSSVDVNEDGKIGQAEVIYILQYMAGKW